MDEELGRVDGESGGAAEREGSAVAGHGEAVERVHGMVCLTDVFVHLDKVLMRFRGGFQGLGPIGPVLAPSASNGRVREMVVEGAGKWPTRLDWGMRKGLGGRLYCNVFEDNGILF